MGKLFMFPSFRRKAFIRGVAYCTTMRCGDKAAAYLRRAIQAERKLLLQKGFPRDVVEADLSALETAIRCAMVKTVVTSGDAA